MILDLSVCKSEKMKLNTLLVGQTGVNCNLCRPSKFQLKVAATMETGPCAEVT